MSLGNTPRTTTISSRDAVSATTERGTCVVKEFTRGRAQQADAIAAWLSVRLAQVLDRPAESIDRSATFHALGLDSVTSVEIAGDLETWLGRSVPLTALFEHPTVSRLAASLASVGPARKTRTPRRTSLGNGEATIGVAGLACRFPGASDPQALCRLVLAGPPIAPHAPPPPPAPHTDL